MQSNYSGNLLRNSYGFQLNDSPLFRGPPIKGFPMPQFSNLQPHSDNLSTTIRQMENKIEGVEGLVKKKYPQQSQISAFNNPKMDPMDSRFQKSGSTLQQPLNEQTLRGSCQNFLKKLDYSNLRNTTHFNAINKVTTHNEIRRSPHQDHNKHILFNKTFTQEYTNLCTKGGDKKQIEGHRSFLSPSRTPPKNIEKGEEKGFEASRTPTKYKTTVGNIGKMSAISKTPPKGEDKKVPKTLNEIIQMKNLERHQKQMIQNLKNNKKCKIVNGFEFGSTLGKGKFGQVFLSRHTQTGFISAIKKIQKKKVFQFKMVDQFVQEIRLHASLDHPNIVKFYGVFQEKDDMYLVMQYMNGGTLFDHLNETTSIPIKTAVQYLKDIIDALTYMHDKSIAHRDIKPQNIVISSQGVAKLCDFGWSAVVETSRKTYCGTFDYAPPQILQRKTYDTSIDIWCIGILTYQLLTGRVPFQGEKRNVVMQKIVNVDKHKIDYPVDLPPQAKEFIESLVQKDPTLRPKCQDLLKFKLFTTYLPKPSKPKKI